MYGLCCVYVLYGLFLSLLLFWILQLVCYTHVFPRTSILCWLYAVHSTTLHSALLYTTPVSSMPTILHIERQNEENICRWYNFRDVWFLTPHKKENEICTTLVFQISTTKRQQTHCGKQLESCEMYVYIQMEIFFEHYHCPKQSSHNSPNIGKQGSTHYHVCALKQEHFHWKLYTKGVWKAIFYGDNHNGYLLSPYREFLGLSSLLGPFQDGMNHRLQYQFRDKLLLVVWALSGEYCTCF